MTANTGRVEINMIAEANETFATIITAACLMVVELWKVKAGMMVMAEIVEKVAALETVEVAAITEVPVKAV
jgi:hypothetical protein